MLKKIKLAFLSAADSTGLSRLALSTSWRNQRLLILCYHGISLEDEHEWDRTLYISPDLLRRRFEHLKRAGCQVLPLGEAIRALYAGELPPRAVAITFDDGFYDFYRRAMPLAEEFKYPLTVYLTTYYSYFNRPVFDPTLNYILWKGTGRNLSLPDVLSASTLVDESTRGPLGSQLYQHVVQQGLSGEQKDQFLDRLASELRFDMDGLRRKRILHLMTPAEVSEASTAGIDVQLHTHRHRVSKDQQQFDREIKDNRDRIEGVTHKPASHFCYPSGFFLPQYTGWLQNLNVQSATTCIPGMANRTTSPLLLPRLVDTANVTDTEFAGWVSGLASLLPQRKFEMDQRSYLEPAPQTAEAPASK